MERGFLKILEMRQRNEQRGCSFAACLCPTANGNVPHLRPENLADYPELFNIPGCTLILIETPAAEGEPQPRLKRRDSIPRAKTFPLSVGNIRQPVTSILYLFVPLHRCPSLRLS